MLKDIIGRNITAMVTDENEKFVFAQKDGMTFRLDKSELIKLPKLGSMITGFAYENEKHQLQLTKNPPRCGFDRYAWGTVKDVQRGLGVFVDIGLKNKDVAVSLDELSELFELWPKKGDRLMIALKVDEKGRLWGTLATSEMFQAVSVRADAKMKNKNVEATAYRLKMAGTYVITSDYYLGFIHPTEREKEPRLGEVLNARVIGIREDGVLNLSLLPRAYEAIDDDSKMLLAALEHTRDGRLPLCDKSSPEEIRSYFGISKSGFKRAVGHLLKAGKIKQEAGFLILIR